MLINVHVYNIEDIWDLCSISLYMKYMKWK